MLRTARLPPGRRALLPHPLPPTSTPTTTLTARPVTFATGKGNTNRPLIFTGSRGGNPKPNPSAPGRIFTRPPSTWSPSSISTIALGSMLAGSWYIMHEGRSYKVAEEVDKYAPRVVGTQRGGTVNEDYLSYQQWVEKHGKGRK